MERSLERSLETSLERSLETSAERSLEMSLERSLERSAHRSLEEAYRDVSGTVLEGVLARNRICVFAGCDRARQWLVLGRKHEIAWSVTGV